MFSEADPDVEIMRENHECEVAPYVRMLCHHGLSTVDLSGGRVNNSTSHVCPLPFMIRGLREIHTLLQDEAWCSISDWLSVDPAPVRSFTREHVVLSTEPVFAFPCVFW